LIVGDFAPVVAAMKRLLVYIDVPNPRTEPKMEVVELNFAVASELEPVIRRRLPARNPMRAPKVAGDRASPRNWPDSGMQVLRHDAS